uniref:Uncharacterized protein n=1 Tax=Percolomonas cosmopolitus TaxID=63605 RepID=A0A7S1KP13_9EUKA|mmetsp:Transcript_2834/g.10833  ORF Transcript_2834/g.10833 Transcript_2834/m.10833 type:complete len:1025 (+) Transcript_2834:3452-6526(+)
MPQSVQVFWSRGKKQNGVTPRMERRQSNDTIQYSFPTHTPDTNLNFTSTLFYDMENTKFKKKTIQFVIQQPGASASNQLIPIGKCFVDLGQQIVDAYTTAEDRSCSIDLVTPLQLQIPSSQDPHEPASVNLINAELHLHVESHEVQDTLESLREKNRDFRKYMKMFKKLKMDHAHVLEQLNLLITEKQQLEEKLQQTPDNTEVSAQKDNTPEPQVSGELDDLETRRKALEVFIQEQEALTKMKEEELRERELELESKLERLLHLESDLRHEEETLREQIRQRHQSFEDIEQRLTQERAAIEQMEQQKNYIHVEIKENPTEAALIQREVQEPVTQPAVVDNTTEDSNAAQTLLTEITPSCSDEAQEPAHPSTLQESQPVAVASESKSSPITVPQLSVLQEKDAKLSAVHQQLQEKQQAHHQLHQQLSPDLAKLEQQREKLIQERMAIDQKKKLSKKKRDKLEKALSQKEQALHAQLDPLAQRLSASGQEIQQLGAEFHQEYPEFLLNVQRYNEQNTSAPFAPLFQVNFAQFAGQVSADNRVSLIEQELRDKQEALDKQLAEMQAQQEELSTLRNQVSELSRSAQETLTTPTETPQVVHKSQPQQIYLKIDTSVAQSQVLDEREAAIAAKEALLEQKIAELDQRGASPQSAEAPEQEQPPANETNQKAIQEIEQRETLISKREAELAHREEELEQRLNLLQQVETRGEGAVAQVATPAVEDAMGDANHPTFSEDDRFILANLDLEKAELKERAQKLSDDEVLIAQREKSLAHQLTDLESREQGLRLAIENAKLIRIEVDASEIDEQIRKLNVQESGLEEKFNDIAAREAALSAKEATFTKMEHKLPSSDFDSQTQLEHERKLVEGKNQIDEDTQKLSQQKEKLLAQQEEEEVSEKLLNVQKEQVRLEALGKELCEKEDHLSALQKQLEEERDRLEKQKLEMPLPTRAGGSDLEATMDELGKLRSEKESLQRKLEMLSAERPPQGTSEMEDSLLDEDFDFEDEPVVQLYKIQWNKETNRFDRIQIQS